ncbi:MAG: histidinol-phosphate transaminase [Polaribacter sp.]|nr:histidinol-phosphate transaminase [Polaribacter sp.]
MKPKISINNLIRDNIRAIKPYSSARDDFKDVSTNDMVFLDANENPFENGVNRYPDPLQKNLKKLVSKIKKIDEESIFLGNGSDEVLDLIVRAFCEPNKDNIITLPPTYGMYGVIAEINAVENRKVLLNNDFQPEVKNILEQIDSNTKILFLCSPNNPTGNSFEASIVEELVQNFEGLVIIDEAYIDFSNEQSWLSRLEMFPNLIIVQTLSKAYALAGIRIGLCYASKEIITVLNSIKPPYNVNELSQQKAISRLHQIEGVESEISELISERKRLKKELESGVSFIEKIYPSDSNFLLIKVDDATTRYNQLISYGMVVRNRSLEPLCNNCLRISVGVSEENQRLIIALKALQ